MAEQLLERAIAAAEVGDDRAARRWVERALAARPDEELRARIVVHQAYQVGLADGVADGLAILDEVDRAPGTSDHVRALSQINRGLLLHRSGSRQASRAFDLALVLLPADDVEARATVHLDRGVARMEARDLLGARADLEQALELSRRTGSASSRAMASANLSYVLMLAGDLPAALRELAEVAPTLSGLSPVLAAKCLANRAEVMLAAGLLEEAAEDLQQAARTFGLRRNPYEQADAEHQLARVRLALGDARGARSLAVRAAHRYRSQGLAARAAQSRCLALEAQLVGGRRVRAVVDEATTTAAWFEAQGLRHDARRARLLAAEAHLALGDPAAAEAVADDAARLRDRDLVVDRLRVRRLRAALADADGRPADADRELRSAVRDLQHQVGLLGSLELRSAIAVHAQEIAQVAVGRALAGGDPLRVLAWAETTRALSSRPSRVTPPSDPQQSALMQELRQLRAGTDGGERVVRTGATDHRVRELERTLRHRAWQHQGRNEPTGTVPVRRLSAELRADGGLMLALLAHRSRLVAVLLGDGPARLVTLGPLAPAVERVRAVRADLDLLASAGVPAGVAAVARAYLDAGLDDLAHLLLGPLQEAAGRRGADPTRPLLVAPTAALSLVPWGLLPLLRGRTLTVSATGASWSRGRPLGPVGAAARVEVVSGPGLRQAAAELRAVAAAWSGARVLHHARAEQVLAAAGRADVLHVAAHGVHEPQSPMFSHLVAADGPVFGHELQGLPRVPRHVVLSACELGCAETRPGDERLGMTAALLALGVGSVVAGVARVEDRVSALVAAEHHRGLAAGLAPARALADAVAALPADAPPAPFVCFGSGW